jgi:hypothetical protein
LIWLYNDHLLQHRCHSGLILRFCCTCSYITNHCGTFFSTAGSTDMSQCIKFKKIIEICISVMFYAFCGISWWCNLHAWKMKFIILLLLLISSQTIAFSSASYRTVYFIALFHFPLKVFMIYNCPKLLIASNLLTWKKCSVYRLKRNPTIIMYCSINMKSETGQPLCNRLSQPPQWLSSQGHPGC